MSMNNIESEVIVPRNIELDLVTDNLCKRISEKLEELDVNYIEFYWYLWEHDSGNTSS